MWSGSRLKTAGPTPPSGPATAPRHRQARPPNLPASLAGWLPETRRIAEKPVNNFVVLSKDSGVTNYNINQGQYKVISSVFEIFLLDFHLLQ